MDVAESINAAYLTSRKVCATGRLVSMTQGELQRIVQECGGEYLPRPRRTGFILVVGDDGWPSEADGSMSQVFQRARRLKLYGYPIEFTTEEAFLENLGFFRSASAIRGPHTLGDLSRILSVPTVRLRKWLRLGLIRAEATCYQIPYFSFHQVSFIKQLVSALERGASLAAIRHGIEQSKELLPHGQSLCELCSAIQQDGRIVMRQSDQLLDHSGQRYFDFESPVESEPVFAEAVRVGIHDLCDEALAKEEAGELESAAETYQRALQLDPRHPTLLFDLGNVLFQLGRIQDSIANFQVALECDPEFAMAWHNLGSVYGQQGNFEEAASALRRAVELVPTYADSHFLLAEVLRNMGRSSEARQHEAAYQEHSRIDCLLASREHSLRVFGADEDEKLTS